MPEQETDGGHETHVEKSDRLFALVRAAPGRQRWALWNAGSGLPGLLDKFQDSEGLSH